MKANRSRALQAWSSRVSGAARTVRKRWSRRAPESRPGSVLFSQSWPNFWSRGAPDV